MATEPVADGTEGEVLEGMLGAYERRRQRMVRWILQHPELDLAPTKGKLTFDLGRRPGSGEAAVAVAFHPVPEDLT